MALTTKILADATTIGTPVASTDAGQFGTTTFPPNFAGGVLKAQRIKDKAGMFQVKAQAGITGAVSLQGRMSPVDAWYNIVSVSQADWNADANFSSVKLVTLFPEMRCVSTITAGPASISAWVTE